MLPGEWPRGELPVQVRPASQSILQTQEHLLKQHTAGICWQEFEALEWFEMTLEPRDRCSNELK